MRSNLVPFPKRGNSSAFKAEAEDVVSAISDWLHAGKNLATIVQSSKLDDDTRLEVLECAQELTGKILQLYLVVLVEGHQADETRARIDAILSALQRA